MEDNRTELQKKFEEQTPTIIGKPSKEYLQTFVSWLHLQVERLQGEKLSIHNVVVPKGTLICSFCESTDLIEKYWTHKCRDCGQNNKAN